MIKHVFLIIREKPHL